MLIPQFSLRTTLKLVTICAVLFLISGRAVQGHAWAVGVMVAVLSVLGTLIVHAIFYGLTTWLSRILGVQQSPARTSQGGLQLSPDLCQPPAAVAAQDEPKEPTEQ